jgi:hypothetical protein
MIRAARRTFIGRMLMQLLVLLLIVVLAAVLGLRRWAESCFVGMRALVGVPGQRVQAPALLLTKMRGPFSSSLSSSSSMTSI